MSVNTRSPIVTNGLVLALDAGNPLSYPGSGTTWRDLSGRGGNGTLINGPTFDNNNGGSIVFDGVNDYVNFGNILNPSILNNNFTIETWFNVSQFLPIFQQRLVSYEDAYVLMFQGTSFRFEILAGSYQTVTAPLPSINTWNQLIGIYNGTQLKLYMNGNLVGTNNASGNIRTNNFILNIGAYQNDTSYRISGKMSITRMYNKELSAQEVSQNYNATKTRFGL